MQHVTRASALCWVCHMTHNGDQPLVCTFFVTAKQEGMTTLSELLGHIQ